MEEYLKKLGLISSKPEKDDENRTWKDGQEFPTPNLQNLRKLKKKANGKKE